MSLPVRCVVVGATGQLGHDLVRSFALPGEVRGLTHADLDVRDAARVDAIIAELRPTHLVNATAYNLVDRAEDERDAAFALNAEAVGSLATAAERVRAAFVHFSTDYVFDGTARHPYREDDAPNPLSVYGASKLEGERRALARCGRAYVVRVSGLFGVARSSGKGTNFVETMIAAAHAGRPLRVVSDQVLTPSYTLDVARVVWRIIADGEPGIWHVTNGGETSWYDFARAIFARAGLAPSLTAVTAAEYGARARRPSYSVLAHTRLATLGADDLRPWDAALAAYLAERVSAAPRGS